MELFLIFLLGFSMALSPSGIEKMKQAKEEKKTHFKKGRK
jgi:hypothetical protein